MNYEHKVNIVKAALQSGEIRKVDGLWSVPGRFFLMAIDEYFVDIVANADAREKMIPNGRTR
jgi:hypothetical protein